MFCNVYFNNFTFYIDSTLPAYSQTRDKQSFKLILIVNNSIYSYV